MDQDEELSQSLSDLSRSLSSEELSAEELSINIQYCHDKISEYTPRNNKDLTKPILGSFIDNLPPDGNRVLCQHILDKTTDQDDLYRLGDHLAKAILAPSWFGFLSFLCGLLTLCFNSEGLRRTNPGHNRITLRRL